MKKLFVVIVLLVGMSAFAQDMYFTLYNFSVEAKDVSTVFKLVDDYYSANKPEGVTVGLYENHFNDEGFNFTHSIVFSGSLDAVGGMYAGGSNASWDLFMTKINQHMKEGFSSAMGSRLTASGDADAQNPFQMYYIVKVDDMDKFRPAYDTMMGVDMPEGVQNMMGTFRAGVGPEGGNVWVINTFPSMKAAIGGFGSMLTDSQNASRKAAWDTFMKKAGETNLVRSGMRIELKTW